VISVWNRKDDLRDNLRSCLAQTVPADEIVWSTTARTTARRDGARRVPAGEARLHAAPAHGACETFNIGFASARASTSHPRRRRRAAPTFVEHMLAKFAQVAAERPRSCRRR